MMKWFGILVLCFSIVFLGCGREDKDIRIANGIIKKTSKELEEKYSMYTVGTGMSAMYEIKNLSVEFQINKVFDKERAREIIVDCAQIFLKNVNENEKIRKYLIQYPFTAENIEIAIFSKYPDGKIVYYPIICVVSLEDGNVVYRTQEENKNVYKTKEKETFEDAVRIIQQGN